jgi:hypothetical protein
MHSNAISLNFQSQKIQGVVPQNPSGIGGFEALDDKSVKFLLGAVD